MSGVFDVISYDGSNDVLVYKFPHTEFNTLSQLIVHESQKAIFFRDGQMLDTLGPGRHTLHTGNIPLLSRVMNLPYGGESPFQCEVYFVNEALAMNYKWGTMGQTRVMDKQFNLLLNIGANGTVGLRVIDPRMLLSRVVGSETELTAEACFNYFRENVSAQMKQYLARVMSKPEMNFLLLEMYLTDFATAVKATLNDVFRDVGVELYNFVIGGVHIPPEEYAVITEGQKDLAKAQYEKKLKKLAAEGDAESMKILADGRAVARRIEGYNWADEQVAEITKIYASHIGEGNSPVNMLAQAPMAMAFGSMLRSNMEPIMGMTFSNPPQNFNQPQQTPPVQVGIGIGMGMDVSPVDGGVPDFGSMNVVAPSIDVDPVTPVVSESAAEPPKEDTPPDPDKEQKKAEIKAKLKEIRELFEDGIIDEDDFKAEKQEYLKQLREI